MTGDKRIRVEGEQQYAGPERRQDCLAHCAFAQMAQNSTPRVYFLSFITASILVAIAIAGWFATSMATFKAEESAALERLKVEIHADMVSHKKQMDMRLSDNSDKYTQDVERFIRATGEIRTAIREMSKDVNEIKVDVGKIKVTQDVVVKKLDLK